MRKILKLGKKIIRKFLNIVYLPNYKVFNYKLLSNGTYSVSANNLINKSGKIKIPRLHKLKKITEIDDYGFVGSKVSKICLSKNIKRVGKRAFFKCENLKNIVYNHKVLNFVLLFNSCPISNNQEIVFFDKNSFEINNVPRIDTIDLESDGKIKLLCYDCDQLFNKMQINFGYSNKSNNRVIKIIDIKSKEQEIILDIGIYGLLKDCRFYLYSNETLIFNFVSPFIPVSSLYYNMAPIGGTYPISAFFSILKTIDINLNIPTYLLIEKPNMIDWENLPFKIKTLPDFDLLKKIDINGEGNFYYYKKYIAELFLINKRSVFNLFVNEFYSTAVFHLFARNNIPLNNVKVNIFSDGTHTYEKIQNIILNKKLIDNTKREFFDAFAYYENNNESKLKSYELFSKSTSNLSSVAQYSIFLSLLFDNFKFWVPRDAYETIKSVSKYKVLEEAFSYFDLKNGYKLYSDKERKSLYKMFKFNSSVFEKTYRNNKEPIIINGGWSFVEKDNFLSYLSCVIAIFGTKNYDYFYKPHPNLLLKIFCINRETEIKNSKLPITYLNTFIPFEILASSLKNFSICSWHSTILNSNDELLTILAIFDEKIDNLKKDKMKMNKSNSICFISPKDENNLLIEFNKNTKKGLALAKKFGFGIYNIKLKEIKYYK